VAVGSLVDPGPNLTGAWIVWKELFIGTCKIVPVKFANTSASLQDAY
jgi:hypothetical protein